MKFGVPRIWREPSDHNNDCYFCIVDPTKRRAGHEIEYPDLPSASAPIPHSDELPVPVYSDPSQDVQSSQGGSSEQSSQGQSSQGTSGSEFESPGAARSAPIRYFPNQNDLEDLCKDLDLPKYKSEILISRLKDWNLVDTSARITVQRKRHEGYSSFFTEDENLCYCHDVKGLFEAVGIQCLPEDWRLFIDSSSESLKAVLLHNGNVYPSVPVAYSTTLKESYVSVKTLLSAIKYEDYGWEVIGDFKMIGFLMGLQKGWTKHPCFLCLWDSRDVDSHYVRKDWPERVSFEVGQKNVMAERLVEPTKVLLPPLHIKLGLVKQFITGLDPESAAFQCLSDIFPNLSAAKIKAGVLTGPQVRTLIASEGFADLLNEEERAAWDSFQAVVSGFLGNNRVSNYEEVIAEMIRNFHAMGCRMSLKIHVLDSHLNEFYSNLGAFSEEQGERFHQEIQDFEHRYRGKRCNTHMMGDYIWSLVRSSDLKYSRKPGKSVRFQVSDKDE